jgi:hypothetical protein
MSPDPATSSDGDEAPRRGAPKPPSAYRPDLRPILVLAGTLLLVIIGWILLSPVILPAPAR